MSRAVRLRYAADSEPGIRRRGRPGAFFFVGANGRRITSEKTLARIKSLAIPSAWENVWICPDPNGHLQATGRDARGRKQYRYANAWRQHRDAHKFERMSEFARALPAIRRQVRADLRAPGLPRRKVLAAIVRLLEETCMRVGNERYAEENGSFGLTTLRNRHARVGRGRIELEFRGKGGKFHRAAIEDAQVARIVRHCRELPGQKLFEYLDEDGTVQSVGSADVNAYLREIARTDVTAKDFRTWAGSVLVASVLANREGPVGPSHVVAAVHAAARRLGNTPAICRKSYVHPRVLDPCTWAARPRGRVPRPRGGLRAEEVGLLRVLGPLRASRTARPRRSTRPPSPRAAASPS